MTGKQRAAELRETAARLNRQIARLTDDDPEIRDCARHWAIEARRALQLADEAERWAATSENYKLPNSRDLAVKE